MKQANIVDKLTTLYADLQLVSGETYYWSPSERTVFYRGEDETLEGAWALLHESGHALLEHHSYQSDFELVQLEIAAWGKAQEIATELGLDGAVIGGRRLAPIDDDHIQDCLDSYRDWMHKRSLCPDCHLSSVQIKPTTYLCIFCSKRWGVSNSGFGRPYRKALKAQEE